MSYFPLKCTPLAYASEILLFLRLLGRLNAFSPSPLPDWNIFPLDMLISLISILSNLRGLDAIRVSLRVFCIFLHSDVLISQLNPEDSQSSLISFLMGLPLRNLYSTAGTGEAPLWVEKEERTHNSWFCFHNLFQLGFAARHIAQSPFLTVSNYQKELKHGNGL